MRLVDPLCILAYFFVVHVFDLFKRDIELVTPLEQDLSTQAQVVLAVRPVILI